jgi:hypothetical protein
VGLVADMQAGAHVIDGLLQLYADAISGKPQDIVQAVRDLVAGKAAIPIALALPRAEATALAQFLKRIGFEDVARFAAATITYDGLAEGEVMWSGVLMLQRALADAGFAPSEGGRRCRTALTTFSSPSTGKMNRSSKPAAGILRLRSGRPWCS